MVKINYKILIIDVILLGVIILIVLLCQFNNKLGASSEERIAYYLKLCDLNYIHNYIVIDSTFSPSFSDELSDYTLLINKNDYLKLVNIIKSKPYFKKYESADSLHYSYDVDSDWSKINEVAYSYKGQISYGRFDPKIGEVIRVTLSKDSILIIELQSL